jgi:cytochrome c oxidase subunit 2
MLASACGSSPPPTGPSSSTSPPITTPVAAAADPPAVRQPDAANGEQVYQRLGCIACHSTDGTPKVGASMRGFAGTTVDLADGRSVLADDAYLRVAILDPARDLRANFPASMPAYEGQISDPDLADLIAYLHSLK